MKIMPYREYKETPELWLGKIPKHWELMKTKHLLKEISEKGYPDEPLLAATQTKGVVPKDHYENRTVLAMKDFHLLKLVDVGDYVISLRSFQGGIEHARFRGIISPAYTVLRPGNLFNEAYLTYLFKSRPYIDNLSLYVTGIRQGQNIDYERLRRSYLPVPNLDEQRLISRYLLDIDSNLSKMITGLRRLAGASRSAEERKTSLLFEYRTRLIADVVTGKLDVREASASLPDEDQFVAPDLAEELDNEDIDDNSNNEMIDE